MPVVVIIGEAAVTVAAVGAAARVTRCPPHCPPPSTAHSLILRSPSRPRATSRLEALNSSDSASSSLGAGAAVQGRASERKHEEDEGQEEAQEAKGLEL